MNKNIRITFLLYIRFSTSKRKFSDQKRNDNKASANKARTSNEKLSTLSDVAKYILSGKAKNIIVMAGAGISTGSGIPDFRYACLILFEVFYKPLKNTTFFYC